MGGFGVNPVYRIDIAIDYGILTSGGVGYGQNLDFVKMGATRFPVVWISAEESPRTNVEFLQDIGAGANPRVRVDLAIFGLR